MRQIKFRAWDKKREIMLAVDNLDINECEILLRAEHSYIPISNVEIMQFTGLKDKNGVEIYDGDILKTDNSYKFIIIKWSEKLAYWEYVDLYDNTSFGVFAESEYDKKFLVIGNIYENPGLLRVNDE